MKTLAPVIVSSILLSVAASSAFAGNCTLNVTRTACPGQEAISFKKCNGEASCEEFSETATADECKAAAVASCENKRLTVTKSKVITATFDDAALKSASGNDDFCADYPNRAAEYDKCGG